MKEQTKKQTEQKQTKREKLTFEKVKEMLNLTVEEIAHATNLLTVGVTPAKIRDTFLKKRKEEIAEKERKEKEKKEKEEIAKKAIEKAKIARELVEEIKNVPDFKNFDKPLLTIKNVSIYKNFKNRTWEIFGKTKIQDRTYLITYEYESNGLFDKPCWIDVEDVIFKNNACTILDFEKDVCLSMQYEKVNK